jgi:Vacuolar sorting 38 and autophagy-related subunit 14
MARETLNPNWDFISSPRFSSPLDRSQSSGLVVSVFVRKPTTQAPPTTTAAVLPPTQPSTPDTVCPYDRHTLPQSIVQPDTGKDELVVQEMISMKNLEWVQGVRSNLPSFGPNTMLFYLPDGIYVLPDVVEYLRKQAIAQEHIKKMFRDRKAAAVDAAVQGFKRSAQRSARNVRSIAPVISPTEVLFYANRICEAQQQVTSLEDQIADFSTQMEEALQNRRSFERRSAVVATRRQRLQQLERTLAKEQDALEFQRKEVKSARAAVAAHARTVADIAELCAEQTQFVRTQIVDRQVASSRKLHSLVTKRLEARRRKLMHHLLTIYPISQPQPDSKLFTIRGTRVVNSSSSQNDEQTSTALGYVCHLVGLLSKYLNIPLRYRLTYRGSRSLVSDDADSFVDAPLYTRGADEQRLEIARILLTQNIEHIFKVRTGQTKRCSADQMLQLLHEFMQAQVPSTLI